MVSNSFSLLSRIREIPFFLTTAGIPAKRLNDPSLEKSLLTRLLDAIILSDGIIEPLEIVVLFPTQTRSPIYTGFVNGLMALSE